ncbi:hypothetical protein LEM8419_02035 [Neolewinella maritima]|uniref:Tetratricopeptide repeat protein n=1 Tax=Neolewinella maritima TaxID=1383882 RepID=A0ABM9B204_9BACT|nr:hypothetical protein [Neolewinella maritima]CAH1001088.1 hypothetical protein LEM8419_02035 [Neolewinella maritima]
MNRHPYSYLLLLALGLSLCTGVRAQCPVPLTHTYRFLNPRVVGYDSQLAPFFLHFGAAYREQLSQPAELQRAANVAEWHERFCDQAPAADIETVVYGNTLNLLRELRRLLDIPEATAADLPQAVRTNAFARHLLEAKCVEVIDYLVFAKECEPFVTRPASAFAERVPARAEMEALIERGLAAFPQTESHYVRLRYAYQLLRLAHYLREYDYVLELYDYLMPKVDADPSLIYDWIEGHRAGALQSLGNYAESAYLFSRIFERSPSKRESAYNSFRIQTDAQWQEALLLCQNDHERAMLHVLRAHNGRAVVVEELRDIYAYEPTNRALELLTMRELQELERELLGENLRPGTAGAGTRDRLIALQSFINRVVEERTSDRPDFWLLARGVLELLAGDHFFARETFAILSARTESDTIRQQVSILEKVSGVLELSRVTDSVELHYYALLTDDALRSRYPSLRPLINDKLEAVYRQTGRAAKADLLRYGFDAIAKNPSVDALRALDRMADSLNRNRFDRALLADRVGPHAVADITNLLANDYLQRGQWKAALELYRRIPSGRIDAYGRFAPFERQFGDRVSYVPPADRATYNKVQLLSRLDELEEEADRTTNDTLAARNYFNIGLALYNLTYFSYNWVFADAFRSGTSAARAAASSPPTEVFPHVTAPLGNREHFSMDQPRYYFERAMRRAPDKEAAAMAAYYAAKTERNEYYARGRPGGSRPFSYFRLLQENYASTDFYDTLIAECKTFAWFVGR